MNRQGEYAQWFYHMWPVHWRENASTDSVPNKSPEHDYKLLTHTTKEKIDMGLRPIERHPSRIVNEKNNFLFFMLLENTKIPVENVEQSCDCDDQACLDDWDGVTHAHILNSGDDVLIQIRTHYNKEQDQYSILDYTVFTGPDGAETGVDVIIARGKTSEELQMREELSDEHLAQVLNLFKEMNS